MDSSINHLGVEESTRDLVNNLTNTVPVTGNSYVDRVATANYTYRKSEDLGSNNLERRKSGSINPIDHDEELGLGFGSVKSDQQNELYRKELESRVMEDNQDITKPPPISIKFIDVIYKVSTKTTSVGLKSQSLCVRKTSEKQIIRGVSGYVLPGEMLALMGPSGSGKTSLLNLLSGRVHHQGGSITYNDLPYSKPLKQRMGFVRQDDILHQHLTVKESLEYVALLRLPRTMSKKRKVERAMEVIRQLGLEKCKDTVIGGTFLRGISGGERKRVCVGHEILINPSLLFLDEPTSGLDSTTALRLIQLLHELSQSGKTIITTIHQPSSRLFHMFEKLLLLAEGQVVYFGKAKSAMDYFSSIGISPLYAMNPADFLLDLASGSLCGMSVPSELEGKLSICSNQNEDSSSDTFKETTLQHLYNSYETILEPNERAVINEITSERSDIASHKRVWSSSWWLQFYVLFTTGLKERRHEYLSWLQISQVVALALVTGALWWHSTLATEKGVQDQIGLIFFVSTHWSMYPLFNALHTFPQERSVLAKERSSDMYRLSAYFIGRIAADTMLNICLPTIFVTIVYFMTVLKQTAQAFFLSLFTIYATAMAAQGLGLTLGAAVMNVRKAITLAAVILLTFMLAGGFFVQNLPKFIGWLRYISYNYYTFMLLIKIQYDNGQMYDCGTAAGCKSIALAPAVHGISLTGGAKEAIILLAIIVIYHSFAYIALRRMKLDV